MECLLNSTESGICNNLPDNSTPDYQVTIVVRVTLSRLLERSPSRLLERGSAPEVIQLASFFAVCVSPNSAQTQPKLPAQTQPKLSPNSAQTQPKLSPNSLRQSASVCVSLRADPPPNHNSLQQAVWATANLHIWRVKRDVRKFGLLLWSF